MPKKTKIKSIKEIQLLVVLLFILVFGTAALLTTNAGQRLLGIHLNPLVNHAQVEKFHKADKPIPGSYIVILNDNTKNTEIDTKAAQLSSLYKAGIKTTYKNSLKGFAAQMDGKTALALSLDPNIKYVEEDAKIEMENTQGNPGWALDRIDQHNLVGDSAYNYSSTASHVNVYVIDTGVLTTHTDIAGRAFEAVNTTGDTTPISQCNGHGTGVAGIIGGTTFGVAKSAKLYSVRVFPCNASGTLSDVLAGVDWVSQHALRPAVVNMSLGSVYSTAMNDAVAASIGQGLTYVVAAGNSGLDACGFSPASVPQAITTGGTNSSDQRVSYSNFGSCVDLFAPGEAVPTIWNLNNTITTYMSGTSAASPYVAGVAALYLDAHPTALPADVAGAIASMATRGVVGNLGARSPNLLLYSRLPIRGNSTAGTQDTK